MRCCWCLKWSSRNPAYTQRRFNKSMSCLEEAFNKTRIMTLPYSAPFSPKKATQLILWREIFYLLDILFPLCMLNQQNRSFRCRAQYLCHSRLHMVHAINTSWTPSIFQLFSKKSLKIANPINGNPATILSEALNAFTVTLLSRLKRNFQIAKLERTDPSIYSYYVIAIKGWKRCISLAATKSNSSHNKIPISAKYFQKIEKCSSYCIHLTFSRKFP